MSTLIKQAHFYQHFENLQLSSKDFYQSLEDLITSYEYPKVVCRVVTLKEGSLFTSKREYFCISKHFFNYYVCAAPFGKSFFISWWMEESADDTKVAMRKIPILKWFVPPGKTFFQADSELMFTKSIEAVIKKAIDKVKSDHGYTATLTEVILQ